MEAPRSSVWVICLKGFLWLTTVVDIVSAAGLFFLAVQGLVNPGAIDSAFAQVAVLPVAGILVLLSVGTIRRAWWLLRLEAVAVLGFPLAAVAWRMSIEVATGSIGAGLAVMLVFYPAAMLAAMHGLRLLACWGLRRRGHWPTPPENRPVRWRVWGVIAAIVVISVAANWLRTAMIQAHEAREQAAYEAHWAVQLQQYALEARESVKGFITAVKAGNEADQARHLAKIRELRLVATEPLLSGLLEALQSADDQMAIKILECLSEDERQEELSAWIPLGYPDAPQLKAGEDLLRFAIEDQRSLELRQSAVEASCRITHGWSGMDKRLAVLERASDPAFAVPPLCRWLHRRPQPHTTLPGRAEVCGFVERWGRADAETVAALEFSATLADPHVVAAAQSALQTLKAKQPP